VGVSVEIFTIGFAGTTAERFFTALRNAGVKRVIDVRLNNTSQLAGFTKKEDLRFFLSSVCGIEYVHVPELAPTQEMLDAFKKHKGDWDVYEREFNELMAKRGVEKVMAPDAVNLGCLLCSEKTPHNCHRRLVAEYLDRHWGNVKTTHLA
jgi:uncharacterized protein (DUF488 family)